MCAELYKCMLSFNAQFPKIYNIQITLQNTTFRKGNQWTEPLPLISASFPTMEI